MNILVRELKGNWRSLVAWSVILAGLGLMVMAIYPSFAADQARLQQFLEAYPKEFLEALGLERLNFGEPVGFYGTEVYLMVTLFGGIYAAMLGAGLLAKEKDEKTIPGYIAVLLGVSAVAVAAAFILYRRRDITI